MRIHVTHGDEQYSLRDDVGLPFRLPGNDELFVAVNADMMHLGNNSSWQRLHIGGLDIWVRMPAWMRVPESTESRSRTSHAKYAAIGDILLEGQNAGVLLQVLPAGKETSCHSHPPIGTHPGTTECFLPLTKPKPLLYTPDFPEGRVIPTTGCHVDVGVPHQLRSPPGSATVTLIYMWPIPHAIWMEGHVPHHPPFVCGA